MKVNLIDDISQFPEPNKRGYKLLAQPRQPDNMTLVNRESTVRCIFKMGIFSL
jgi:hypothetical protein